MVNGESKGMCKQCRYFSQGMWCNTTDDGHCEKKQGNTITWLSCKDFQAKEQNGCCGECKYYTESNDEMEIRGHCKKKHGGACELVMPTFL